MKKKLFNINKFLIWGGIPSALIAVGTFIIASSKTITVYADLPQQVEQTKNEVSEIAEVLKRQQMINDYIANKEKKQDVQPIVSPDNSEIWDSTLQKWIPNDNGN